MKHEIATYDAIRSTLYQIAPFNIDVPLVRIGPDSDGGYLIANDLDGVTDCFSAGVGDSSEFEESMHQQYAVKTHLLDGSVEGPANSHKPSSFIRKFLGPETTASTINLIDWTNALAVDQTDLVLKMDIEGAEYEVLESLSVSTLSAFRVIVIEFHKFERIFTRTWQIRIQRIFELLTKNHSSIHIHPNNASRILNAKFHEGEIAVPRVFEITLHRTNRISLLGRKQIYEHPLDFPNVNSRPDLRVPHSMFVRPTVGSRVKLLFRHIGVKELSRSIPEPPQIQSQLNLKSYSYKNLVIPVLKEDPSLFVLNDACVRGQFPVVINSREMTLFNETITHRDYDSLWHGLPHNDYYTGEVVPGWLSKTEAPHLYEVDDAEIDYQFSNRAVFLGGSSNFGHNLWEWLMRIPQLRGLFSRTKCTLVYYEEAKRLRDFFELCFPDHLERLIPIPKSSVFFAKELFLCSAPFRRTADKKIVVHAPSLHSVREMVREKVIPISTHTVGIFVTRRDASIRRLLNTDEVASLLRNFGVDEFPPEKLSFAEQLSVVMRSKIVVSVFGAGSCLAAFAPADALVVEISPSRDIFGIYNGIISAAVLGQRFERVFGLSAKPSGGVSRGALFDDFYLDELQMHELCEIISNA